MVKRNNIVFGFGINDSDSPVTRHEVVDGKRKAVWVCPYHNRWSNLMKRCYSKKNHKTQPTYMTCTVCEEWKYFSNFKKWMETQDWEGKQLDKDILVKGNKVYSPDTCIFLHRKVNAFLLESGASRGKYLIGVTWSKNDQKFRAQCADPFHNNSGYLGLFNTEIEAHTAWKNQKHLYACQLADSEYVDDPRLAEALRTRYL